MKNFAGALLAFVVGTMSPVLASAQTRIVVVPWSVGDGTAATTRATEVRAAVPSPFAAIGPDEARTRFLELGSAEPPVVTDREIDHWLSLSRDAVRQLARADYAGARALLDQTQELSERAAAELNREQERARQVLDTCLFGVRAFVETDDPGADAATVECRRLVPRTDPSPHIHTPEVVDLLARVDRRLREAHTAHATIASDPSDCAVRANGIVLGRTPLVVSDLGPGTYRVQVECAETGRGRVHRLELGASEVTLNIDARFDASVSTAGALALTYAAAADADAHRVADAVLLARTLGVDEAWIVGANSVQRVVVSSATAVASVDGTTTTASEMTAALASERVIATAEPAATATDTTTTTSPAQPSVDPVPWIVFGVGAAALIAGAVMVGVGVPDFDATAEPHSNEQVYAAALARQNTADVLIGVGAAAAGVGLALAVTGLALAVGGGGSSDVQVSVGPTGAAVTGRF